MRSIRKLFAVTALIASSAANANLITNGSFENGLTGWTVVNHEIAWLGVGNTAGLSAFDGDGFLDLTGYTDGSPPFGGVTQSFATTAGTPYLVTFSLGSSTFYGRPSVLTVSAAGASEVFTSPLTGGDNDWEPRSMRFVATGATTELSFLGSAGQYYIGLDNVSASAVQAVPEPSTVSLLLGAGIILGHLRRRNVRSRLTTKVRS